MAGARLLGNRGPVQVLGTQVYSTSPAAKPPFLHHTNSKVVYDEDGSSNC